MSLAIVYCRASSGIRAPLVTVEVHLSKGLPRLNMVGLAEAAVKESRDRVRSAIINSHFEFPIRHITINLAPADLPKEGGCFDLAIALGILGASKQIPLAPLRDHEFCGELALSGELRPVRGILPTVIAVQQSGRKLIIPLQNNAEAALAEQAPVFAAKHLLEVCAYLKGEQTLMPCRSVNPLANPANMPDMCEVKGQIHAKRALEVAAAGRHSLLFVGPPGTGKTMLALRLPSLLPPLDEKEALEIAAINSLSSGGFEHRDWKCIPFRSPHHSSSSVALVGGGRPPRPGEISLAHHGILFLDELPEFNRHVLESLREPLEAGVITIARAAYHVNFPAQFQFIAAMNPCPCGYAGSREDECRCSPEQIRRYLNKLSGPLLDRIDMQIEVARIHPSLLAETDKNKPVEKSITIRERVIAVRLLQQTRQGKCNAFLNNAEITTHCPLETSVQTLLNQLALKFNYSARIYFRLIKLARTIADLESASKINHQHISEALSFRSLDRHKMLNMPKF